MRKILILPIFAVFALISQVWGAYTSCASALGETYYCQWPTGCYELNKGPTDADNCNTVYSECRDHGYLYTDVTLADRGDNKTCKNSGTWAGVGNNPNFNGGTPIWCQWDSGCQPIKNEAGLETCKADGSVYKNVTNEGAGNKCNGTWTGDGKDPNFNGGVPIWCQWYSPTSCHPITQDSILTKCKAYGSVYKEVTSSNVGDGKTCNGTWTGEGRDPNPPNPPSSSSVAATTPSSSSEAAAPTQSSSSEATTPSSPSTQSSSSVIAGTSSSSSGAGTTSSSSGETDPIISHNNAPVIGLNVVNFARSLRIASDKNATISLFDINGKQVLSQRVLSGTTTISLEKQKVGVYYAIAKSGSQKQIVKIVLK